MVLAGSTPLLRPSRGPQDFFETKIISKIRGHKRETLALGLLVLPHDGGLTLNHSSLSRNLKVNWSNGRNGLLTDSLCRTSPHFLVLLLPSVPACTYTHAAAPSSKLVGQKGNKQSSR